MAEDTAKILTAISELRTAISSSKEKKEVDLSPLIAEVASRLDTIQGSINIVVSQQNIQTTAITNMTSSLEALADNQTSILAAISSINISPTVNVEEFQE